MSSTASHKTSETLGLWEPKRTLTLEAARRHSKAILLIRRIIYAFAAVLLLMLIWQFVSQGPGLDLEDSPEESVRMVNPRYTGRTDDGLPFYLTSNEAIRTLEKNNEVELIKPVLEFYREAGADKSLVIADRGTYDDESKVLNLYSEVDLNTDDGNHCQTTHARIFTQTKTIEGDEPIRCKGDFGTVNGNAYEILEDYKLFIFKNGMDAVLDQEEEVVLVEGDVDG